MSEAPIRFRVVANEQGMMLRQVLSKRLRQCSLQEAAQIIKSGGVYIGHVRIRVPSVRVAEGERISVYSQVTTVTSFDPDELVFVHRDPYFVIVRKPSGVPLVASKASARGTISQALVQRLHQEGVLRPYVGLVHGLEPDASGIVLFTVRGSGSYSVHSTFRSWRIVRSYRLQVHGKTPETVSCENGNGKEPIYLRQIAVVEHVSATETLMEAELISAASTELVTCLKKHGFSLVELPQWGLYAYRIKFDHPITGEKIDVRDTLPAWAQAEDE